MAVFLRPVGFPELGQEPGNTRLANRANSEVTCSAFHPKRSLLALASGTRVFGMKPNRLYYDTREVTHHCSFRALIRVLSFK
jgi:hypothetical protein